MVVESVECIKMVQLLEGEKIEYKILKVPLSKINWSKSARNAGRVGRQLDEALVDDYALQMLDGDQFPMGCLAKDGEEYVIVAGNHRTHARRKAGFTYITAYVITLKHDHEYRSIAFLSNRKEGRREDISQAIAFAANVVFETGCTAKEAARKFGVKPGRLQSYIKALKVRQHCESLNLRVQNLNQQHMIQLKKVTHSDNVLRESVRVASVPSMTADRLSEVIDEVKEQGTEAKQLACLEDVIEQHKSETPQKRGGITMDVHAKFNRIFNTMMGFVNGTGEIVSGISYDRESDEFKTKKTEWKSLRRAINKILS